MNLAKHNDLLSIMSSKVKENIEILGQVFHNSFEEKHSTQDISVDLEGIIIDKVQQIELRDVKLTLTLCDLMLLLSKRWQF